LRYAQPEDDAMKIKTKIKAGPTCLSCGEGSGGNGARH
jgi:hypothetical protein